MAKKQSAVSLNPILEVIDRMRDDVEKFNKGMNAPGARIRKGAMEIKNLCSQLRKDVSDIRNSR